MNKKLSYITSPEVQKVFDGYPEFVRDSMEQLRELVIETAKTTEGIEKLEETLKWGEPAYLTEKGSTLRIDWKAKTPNQFAMYFKCTSKLVPTFRQVFKDRFQFEGNRAIIFKLNEKIPTYELKLCIQAALRYHQLKHLQTLGL